MHWILSWERLQIIDSQGKIGPFPASNNVQPPRPAPYLPQSYSSTSTCFPSSSVVADPSCTLLVSLLLFPELAHPKASLHGMKNFLPSLLPLTLTSLPPLPPSRRVGGALSQEKDQQSSITWMAHRIARAAKCSLPFPPSSSLLPHPHPDHFLR